MMATNYKKDETEFENTSSYHKKLHEALDKLKETQLQIHESALKAEKSITSQFSDLRRILISALDQREKKLLTDVSVAQCSANNCLKDCCQLIESQLTTVESCTADDLTYQNSSDETKETNILEKPLSESLPEVPQLSHIGEIRVHFPDKFLQEQLAAIETHGRVLTFSAIQILSAEERPGGLLVSWTEKDDDDDDMHLFRLECCHDDVRTNIKNSNNFNEIYQGQECNFMVHGLLPNTPYTFRVSSCNSIDKDWNSWSELYVASTTLPPYEWDSSNPCYMLTSDGRIATKINNLTSVLYSKIPLQRTNHTLVFHILELNTIKCSNEGIALVNQNQCNMETCQQFLEPGAIFINLDGLVYVDGKEMTTRLPCIKRSSMVLFHIESLASNKVRVTIERGEKQVTYDWKLIYNELNLGLYFAICFVEKECKISVE